MKEQKSKKIQRDRVYIDIETGEEIKGGDIIDKYKNIIPQEKEEIREEKISKYLSKNYIKEMFGGYYHLIYGSFFKEEEVRIKELKPSYVVRFLRMACETEYHTGLLVDLSRKPYRPLTKRQIRNILDISDAELSKTLSYLIENEFIIYSNKENIFSVNKDYIVKGELKQKRVDTLYNGTIRIFLHSFRYIYDNCTPTKRKTLFHLLKLLPYINVNYNILSYNPLEKDPKKIQPLKIKDIYKILDLDPKTNKKIFKSFLELSLAGKGLLMLIATNGEEICIVNPSILYAGNCLESLKTIQGWMNEGVCKSLGK